VAGELTTPMPGADAVRTVHHAQSAEESGTALDVRRGARPGPRHDHDMWRRQAELAPEGTPLHTIAAIELQRLDRGLAHDRGGAHVATRQ
jgi:hypothetical protein